MAAVLCAQLVPGEHFGAYVIESELGRGGQGVVYRARQRGTERSVALKLFAEIEDETKRARFRREAVAAARVEHANIVPVYESGDVDGVPFLAMRLVPGPSLAEVLARFGALAPPRALGVLTHIAAAVDAAHAQNLIHRDIKPANVLLDVDDTAFLSDFGVARVDDLPRLTQRGDWLGTVEYMSPEQAEGRPATAASDLYAFGVVCFEALTGRPPFVHRQSSAVLIAHVRDRPPPVRGLDPRLPAELDEVFAAVLAKDPARRPRSAEDVVRRLRAAFAAHADTSHPDARDGDTRVHALPAAGGSEWTAVVRRVSNDATMMAPRAPAGGGAQVPPAPAPRARHPRRVRRVLGTLAVMLLVAAGAAAAGMFYEDRNDPDMVQARDEAYHNGFRNGVTRGRTKGLADGRKAGEAAGLKKGIAQGRDEGYASGLADGKTVPDASPGDLRLVRVNDDGTADYVDGTLSPGSCFRIDSDGQLIPLPSVSPFISCADTP